MRSGRQVGPGGEPLVGFAIGFVEHEPAITDDRDLGRGYAGVGESFGDQLIDLTDLSGGELLRCCGSGHKREKRGDKFVHGSSLAAALPLSSQAGTP